MIAAMSQEIVNLQMQIDQLEIENEHLKEMLSRRTDEVFAVPGLIREAMRWVRTWDDSEQLDDVDEATGYFLRAHKITETLSLAS